MQWKKITGGLGNTVFSLWSNGRKLLTLAYQNQSDKVYIESEDGEKRHFKCKNKGLLKNQVVLENEYGTNLGKLKKEGSREFILIGDKKYYLNFLNDKEVEIIEENAAQPLTVCSIDVEAPANEAHKGLLMILCYYLLGHPQQREQPAMVM